MRILFLLSTLLPLSSLIESGQSSSRVNQKVFKYDFTAEDLDACRDAMNDYSEKLSAYSNCTLVNLHPSSMCVKCRKLFLETKDAFFNLTIVSSRRKNVTCKELYITGSGLPLDSKFIQASFDQITLDTGGFLRAQCHKCFQNCDIKRGNLARGLKEVFQAYDELSDCYDRYFQSEPDEHEHGPNHPLCQSCNDLFQRFMDTYLEKLADNDTSKRVLGNMCLDVVDRVLMANEVYDEFHCRFTYPINNGVMAAVMVTIILPLLFYVPFIYMCLTEKHVKREGLLHTSLCHPPCDDVSLIPPEKNVPEEACSSDSDGES